MDRRRQWIRWAPLAALGLVAGVALAAGVTVSHLEERDTFCISCHTAPEVTYHDRAQSALAAGEPFADLSSAHYGMERTFRCIDCHRGTSGLVHRLTTLTLGARDAAIWLTGRADLSIEKTQLVLPQLLNSACTRCHAEALLEVGFENHFHNKLPEAFMLWRAGQPLKRPPDAPDLPEESMVIVPSPTDVQCVDCHRAHIDVPGSELQGYLDLANTVYPACVQCHEEAGHGPLELSRQ